MVKNTYLSSLTVILVEVGFYTVAACGGRTMMQSGAEQSGGWNGNEDAGRTDGAIGTDGIRDTDGASGTGGVSGKGGAYGAYGIGGAGGTGGVGGKGGTLGTGAMIGKGGAIGSGGRFGGATGGGGATGIGDGGADVAVVLPSCAMAPLIDDMEDGTGRIRSEAGRVGVWYAFNDGRGTQVPAPTTNGEPIATAEIPGGRGTSMRAMHTSGSGFTNWGVGIGLDLNYDGTRYSLYDASACDGITFWARSDTPGSSISLRIGSAATTSEKYGGTCTNEPCASVTVGYSLNQSWTRYPAQFSLFSTPNSGSGKFEPNKLTNIQFVVLGGGAFDFWIDDIEFIASGSN